MDIYISSYRPNIQRPQINRRYYCRNPIQLRNLETGICQRGSIEDFMDRLVTNRRRNRCCSKNVDSPKRATCIEQQEKSESTVEPTNICDTLIEIVRQTMEELNNDTRTNNEEANQNEISKTQLDSKTTVDEVKEVTKQNERIIPIITSNSSDYEIKFNFEGCSSDSINLDIKDGLFKVTGKKEEEGVIKTISYERKAPADVDSSSLEAKFLEDGTLKITRKRSGSIPTSK